MWNIVTGPAKECTFQRCYIRRADANIDDLIFYIANQLFDRSSSLLVLSAYSGLSKRHSRKIDSQRRRAIRIIFGDISYMDTLLLTNVDHLSDRRETHTALFNAF